MTAIVAKFHILHPRIPDLQKGGCHCELLAQIAADAILSLLPPASRPTDRSLPLGVFLGGARDLKAGRYDDPITTRRRLARAARPEDFGGESL